VVTALELISVIKVDIFKYQCVLKVRKFMTYVSRVTHNSKRWFKHVIIPRTSQKTNIDLWVMLRFLFRPPHFWVFAHLDPFLAIPYTCSSSVSYCVSLTLLPVGLYTGPHLYDSSHISWHRKDVTYPFIFTFIYMSVIRKSSVLSLFLRVYRFSKYTRI
jgi:hypothetical protein